MNTPNIEKLLVRYYNDELPADQTARVAAWIAASEENRKIAEQVYYICFAAETGRQSRPRHRRRAAEGQRPHPD